MRTILSTLAVAVVAVSLTAGPAGADPKKDSVKGNGANNPPNGVINTFKLNVQSDANGGNVKGTVTFTSTDAPKRSFTADATCLNVQGSQATIVADVSKFRKEPGGFDANGVIVYVEDNGKKVAGQSMDEIRNSITPVENLPATCPIPTDPNRASLSKGDIRVEDA